jgi:hypothetical protein
MGRHPRAGFATAVSFWSGFARLQASRAGEGGQTGSPELTRMVVDHTIGPLIKREAPFASTVILVGGEAALVA